MIKILIMDDSRPKTEAIKRYLTDDCLLPSDNIDTAITVSYTHLTLPTKLEV